MGKTIHCESFDSNLCPCKDLSYQIHHILTYSGSTELYICKYRATDKFTFATVNPTDLITTILFYVSILKLHHSGIKLDLVRVHSI